MKEFTIRKATAADAEKLSKFLGHDDAEKASILKDLIRHDMSFVAVDGTGSIVGYISAFVGVGNASPHGTKNKEPNDMLLDLVYALRNGQHVQGYASGCDK